MSAWKADALPLGDARVTASLFYPHDGRWSSCAAIGGEGVFVFHYGVIYNSLTGLILMDLYNKRDLAMIIKIGDIVFGKSTKVKYEIIDLIGNGSFGVVFAAQDQTGEKYAIKTINTNQLNKRSLSALKNEASLAMKIHHKNVLKVIFFHDGDQYPELSPYMILEYADGGTLEEKLNERRITNTQFTRAETQNLLVNLAQGMKAINEELIHRDVKPDNILFVQEVPKIADFGLSKIIGMATRTSTFKGINHIKYCAPEAWVKEENNIAMDMYSMGIVFYEIATLKYPYSVLTTGNVIDAWKNAHFFDSPQSPRKINPDLDNNIAQVIIKLIDKRPDRRYHSWNEVLMRLSNTNLKTDSKMNIAISELVEKAMAREREEEDARLKAQEEVRKSREHHDKVAYCFDEIVDAAKNCINLFNSSSDFAGFEILKNQRFSFIIRRTDHKRHQEVRFQVNPVFEKHELNGRYVQAWGFVKTPSDRGFNLILVTDASDEIYGNWFTIHVSESPMAQSNKHRQSPFPFEIDELPREIQLLNSTHIYDSKVSEFAPRFIVELLEELL
jgi:eukaryotic-like serine/threonine-protein kinase